MYLQLSQQIKNWVCSTVIFWVCGIDIKYLSKSSLTVAAEPISYSCDCARRTAISVAVKKKQAGNRFHILAKCNSMEKCLCPESGQRSQKSKNIMSYKSRRYGFGSNQL